jgi:large subunit ribosomal protein L30
MSEKQKKPAEPGADKAAGGKKLRVTLVKGLTGTIHKHRESVKGLGLRHREHTVEVADTPAIRGMINRVSYLVKVEE